MNPKSTELTVGEVARRSGVAVSALHFYERRGLITSRRTSGNQRRYRRDVLRRVAFIRTSRRVGMSLERIAEALATLPADHAPSRRDWARLSRGWREDLEARIDQLERLRDTLTDCIGCGCLSLATCGLNNPDDELSATGSGPRRLLVDGVEDVGAGAAAGPGPGAGRGAGAGATPRTNYRLDELPTTTSLPRNK